VDTEPTFASVHVERIAQELNIPYVGYRRLFPVYFQKQFPLDEGYNVHQRSLCRPLAFAKDDTVVGIAHKAVSTAFQLLVQLIEHDVAQ